MKPLPVLSLSLISIGLVLSPAAVRADDPATPPAPPAAPAAPQAAPADASPPAPAPSHRHMRQAYSLDELADKLGLTADQQKKVGDIIKSGRSQIRELRGDDSISKDDKRAKMREIMASTHGRIRAALTAGQQAQFDAMPARGGKPGNPDNN